ncbi:diguanylate cyclase [Vibrio lentus]|nr:diguanylate cyclase [Vibrio lentus]
MIKRKHRNRGRNALFGWYRSLPDINDSLGHYNGDQPTIIAAARLRGAFFANGVLAVVICGDICVMIHGTQCNSRRRRSAVAANRLLQTFASPFSMESENVVIKVSIGVVHVSNDQDVRLYGFANSSIALSKCQAR